MDSLREYALSIIVITLICSIISSLLQSSTAKEIVKMVSGMILTLTVAAPLWRIELSIPEDLGGMFLDAANAAASEGESLSRNALESVIQQELEAYIQDKAAELNAEVTAQVTLTNGDPPMPEGAVIKGDIAPYAKQQLQRILQTQLGIAKEGLEWTG